MCIRDRVSSVDLPKATLEILPRLIAVSDLERLQGDSLSHQPIQSSASHPLQTASVPLQRKTMTTLHSTIYSTSAPSPCESRTTGVGV
eukprot:12844461-Prorocentrum_lima.AAC.1